MNKKIILTVLAAMLLNPLFALTTNELDDVFKERLAIAQKQETTQQNSPTEHKFSKVLPGGKIKEVLASQQLAKAKNNIKANGESVLLFTMPEVKFEHAIRPWGGYDNIKTNITYYKYQVHANKDFNKYAWDSFMQTMANFYKNEISSEPSELTKEILLEPYDKTKHIAYAINKYHQTAGNEKYLYAFKILLSFQEDLIKAQKTEAQTKRNRDKYPGIYEAISKLLRETSSDYYIHIYDSADVDILYTRHHKNAPIINNINIEYSKQSEMFSLTNQYPLIGANHIFPAANINTIPEMTFVSQTFPKKNREYSEKYIFAGFTWVTLLSDVKYFYDISTSHIYNLYNY
ncbi:hypothetical protein AAIR98_001085 [Elusimicrobium simillimum]|uniref:hypothetical protein n=1 Tax=Elusimicrobium simillimum TaxID=3143438 RepID=UPI003C6FD337